MKEKREPSRLRSVSKSTFRTGIDKRIGYLWKVLLVDSGWHVVKYAVGAVLKALIESSLIEA